MNVFVYVMETVIAHASEEEPGSDVLVLLFRDRLLTLCSAVHKDSSEMAWELSFVLGNQAPLRIFLSLGTFQIQSSNFAPSKFEPEHVVCQIQVQVVLFGV